MPAIGLQAALYGLLFSEGIKSIVGDEWIVFLGDANLHLTAVFVGSEGAMNELLEASVSLQKMQGCNPVVRFSLYLFLLRMRSLTCTLARMIQSVSDVCEKV